MAIKKTYYRRAGNKRKRTYRKGRRLGKFSRGNRRSGGYYRFLGRGRNGGGLRLEKKYLDTVFANDNCIRMTTSNPGSAFFGAPGANNAFRGDNNDDWYLHVGQRDVVDGASADQWQGLCRPYQGPGPSQRIGRKVCLKSILMRIKLQEVHNAPPDTPTSGGVRMILFIDTQANGALPKQEDLFSPTLIGVATQSGVNAGGVGNEQNCSNLENSQRFRILMDKTIQINSATINVSDIDTNWIGFHRQQKVKLWSKYMKLPNIEIEMAGAESNYVNCKSNALHWCVKPFGAPIFISGRFRVRYTDV